MKTRSSTASDAKRMRRRFSGPSLYDLPNNILVTILLSLPIKTIFVCKCVCKAWYDLIADPHFAKLHFNLAQVYFLIRTSCVTALSRMLYLVQPDEFDMCYDSSPINIKLDYKLKLPLRNINKIPDNKGVESKNCMKLNMEEHKYRIVNSCNGFLCLSNPSNNDPLIVCNPVTGEFIYLPGGWVRNNAQMRGFKCGFGFSPVTNQYKVIRLFVLKNKHRRFMRADVHTLGTNTWKEIPLLYESDSLLFPTYLNGCVYWLSHDYGPPYFVTCFDVGKECFESILAPPLLEQFHLKKISMGVLGRKIFISTSGLGDRIRVWAMNDNGANKSWSQIFGFPVDNNQTLPNGAYQPIKYLNNGALLMLHSHKSAFMCKDPRKERIRFLKVQGLGSKVEVITHIPSFVPMKHALSGYNVKVHNVKARCAKLKLDGEGTGISIVEEDEEHGV